MWFPKFTQSVIDHLNPVQSLSLILNKNVIELAVLKELCQLNLSLLVGFANLLKKQSDGTLLPFRCYLEKIVSMRTIRKALLDPAVVSCNLPGIHYQMFYSYSLPNVDLANDLFYSITPREETSVL